MANKTVGGDRRPKEAVKADVVRYIGEGMLVAEALKLVGRSMGWYKLQRQEDPVFREQIDKNREIIKDPTKRDLIVPDFPEFCEQYLGMKLWPHQLNMFDMLEGREPRALHPSMTYEMGASGARRILINIPPNHAKSMTVTISYVLWKILKDPSMSVLVISKTQNFAAKLLWAIKQRLTHPRYQALQLAFGPTEGFKATAEQWSATKLYLWGDQRDSQEKDPTIEAVGMGGQIYGARAKLILIDDAVVLSNAHQWESQMDWIRQEVASRIGPDDQLVVVGTRVSPIDLYSQLRNPDHYNDHVIPWSYLGMPAVLEYTDDVEGWIPLWPVSDQPFSEADVAEEGMIYDRWTGPRLSRVRNEVGPRRWSLVYQQMDVDDEAIFQPECIRGSIDGYRGAGQLQPGVPGHPDSNAQLFTVIGVDPAVKGNTAVCVYTLDRKSGRRWVLDMRVMTSATPKIMKDSIKDCVEKYRPEEVIIEANAFQLALVQDEELTEWMAARGIPMRPHYTYANKKDETYGVAAMSSLFGSSVRNSRGIAVHQKDNIISLPNQSSAGIKKLVDELIAWNPEKTAKAGTTDCLMALWFCELRAKELMFKQNRASHYGGANKFLSERDKARRFTVRLDDVVNVQEQQGVFM